MSVGERQRIRWSADQRQMILDEAVSLRIQNPRWNNLRLIREAQKILPIEDRRNLAMVSWKLSFKWFADGIGPAIEKEHNKRLGLTEQVVSENNKLQDTENSQSNDSLDLEIVPILSTLVKAMEELTRETAKGLPVGIVGRLDDLQTRLGKIESRFLQFMDQGFLVRLVPAPGGIPVQTDVQKEIPVVLPTSIPEKKLSSEDQKKVRKPRVVVVNTDSGHVQHGIQRGVQGFVRSVKFETVYGLKTPEFKDFDYVLAYKKTPVTWIQEAKKFYPPGKFRSVCGGAMAVADAIKDLPPVAVTD